MTRDSISINSVRFNRPGGRGWRLVGVLLALLAFGLDPAPVAAQTPAIQVANDIITTVAGNGTGGFSGDGGPAVAAQMSPGALAVDAAGNLYIGDFYRVRKVDALTGIITTVAGNGTKGDSGDGGPATSAELIASSLAVDSRGNLYIGDFYSNSVRKVDAATGIITTVAGTGTAGYSGDGGPATAAMLNQPYAVAVDSADNLFISDSGNSVVRKVDAGTGTITTVAGGAATASLSNPAGIALDRSGHLYIADSGSNQIVEVDLSTGAVTIVAGNGTQGYSGDGGLATAAAFSFPLGVAVDAVGNVYIDDAGNDAIRKVDAATGLISTLTGGGLNSSTGDGGPASAANITSPGGIALDQQGALYIATQYTVRRVGEALPAFPPTPVGSTATPETLVLQVNGPLTLTAADVESGFEDFTAGALSGCSLNTPLTAGTLCDVPVTFQPTLPGERTAPLLVTDSNGNRYLFPLHALGTGPQAALTPGVISTVAGNGTVGYSGDGGPATQAELSNAQALALDGAGNLYIADAGNSTIRKVDAATGNISTLAGNGTASASELNHPDGVAVDGAGNVFLSDDYNGYVRELPASGGVMLNLAGTGGTSSSQIASPAGMATDLAGNLDFADAGLGRIDKIDARTLGLSIAAGNPLATGQDGFSGDGGPAVGALMRTPTAVDFNAAGDLYIADTGNERIRKVTKTTGIIDTIAGIGDAAETMSGMPAAQSPIGVPTGVSLDPAGDFYLAASADGSDFTVRRVDAGDGRLFSVAGAVPSDIAIGLASSASGGDGGAATSASLPSLNDVAVSGNGDIFLTAGDRVRKVDVHQGQVDFGPVDLGTTSSPRLVQITNTGNALLQLSGLSLTPSVFAQQANGGQVSFFGQSGDFGPDCTPTTQLKPGASCAIAITATPAAAGVTTGTVVITDNSLNAAAAQQTIPLSVTAAGAQGFTQTITFPPIPDQLVGAQVTLQATASSGLPVTYTLVSGPATLSGSTLSLTGLGTVTVEADQAGDSTYQAAAPATTSFAVKNAASATTLAASAATVTSGSPVTLTATVTATGGTPTGSVSFLEGSTVLGAGTLNSSGVATYTVNNAAVGTHTYTVSYGGDANLIGSTATAVTVTVTVDASLVPASLDFPAQTLHTISTSKTLTLTNLGAGALAISDVTVSGDFSINNSCSGSLAAGAFCDIQVSFAPSLAGKRAGTLTVKLAGDTLTTPLSGTGGTNQVAALQPLFGVITTVAGNGTTGDQGDGGAATAAQLSRIYGLTVDAANNVYISTLGRVRKVDAATGLISTYAGGGTASPGDGGPATAAQLGPYGLDVDANGNLYFADAGNRIRRVDAATGVISTLAGDGTAGDAGDGGPATAAQLDNPIDVKLDSAGNLEIATYHGRNVLRSVDAASGTISTLMQDDAENSGPENHDFDDPYRLAVDSAGNLYYSDLYAGVVRKRDAASGAVTTVAGGGTGPYLDGWPAASAKLAPVTGVAVDSAGNLYFSEPNSGRVGEVSATAGILYTVAGGSTTGLVGQSPLNMPGDLALDHSGNLYIADNGSHLVQELHFGEATFPLLAQGGSETLELVLLVNRTVTITGYGIQSGGATFAASNFRGHGCSLNTPINPGAECTIDVTYQPTSGGVHHDGLLISTGDGTQYVYPLTGTSPQATGPAQAVLSKTTLKFGPQIVNSTSTAQAITLSNPGSSALALPSLTATGPFAETDDCGSSLAAGAVCTIQVTFSPTTAGSQNGTVELSDTAGHQTVVLSGTGNKFGLAMANSGSSSQSVRAGQTATYAMTMSPNGYSGPVVLSCSGGPAGSSCAVSPTLTDITGTQPVAVTVTVKTAATTSLASMTAGSSGHGGGAAQPPFATPAPVGRLASGLRSAATGARSARGASEFPRSAGGWRLALLGLLLTLPLLRKPSGKPRRALGGALVGTALLLAACSGGSGSGSNPPGGSGSNATPSTVTVTAVTSGGSQTVKLSLTVQ